MFKKISMFFNDLKLPGKLALLVVAGLAIWGFKVGYTKLFPAPVKNAIVTTKASSNLPPLAYDKGSNVPAIKMPDFNEPAEVQGPETRFEVMGWNGQMGAMLAIGGAQTAKGSLAEQDSLNLKISVQNNTGQQGNDLYAFAQAYHNGEQNPTAGCQFIIWMGDGVPSYFTGLEARLKKDFGPEFVPEVIDFVGASYGEDKWLVKPKYAKDARGSVTSAVIRDGDWDVAVVKCQLNGWPVNYDNTTYDPLKVNFVPAANDDYIEAAKAYVGGQKVTLKLVRNGKKTDVDTTVTVNGTVTWFPGDKLAVQQKGGLVCIASTKDFASQMGAAVICIKKWAEDNRDLVQKVIEVFGKGGDQVKAHDEALQFASQVSNLVYKDQTLTDPKDWYNGYKSYDVTDDDGNVVNVGGSRVFNLADAAAYTGVAGGRDTYKAVYNTFGSIDKEAYPEVIPNYPDYAEVTDWSYLRAAYNKNKGTGGQASKMDFSTASKGSTAADANYSIQFQTGSATISPASYSLLNKIADQLTVASDLFVEVAGHTDNTGDPAKNQALSEARANAVKDYILTKDPEGFGPRTSSKGYGQERPLNPTDDQSSPSVRAKNRRVEIKLNRAN